MHFDKGDLRFLNHIVTISKILKERQSYGCWVE